MSEVTSPIILDTTGQDIADALTDVANAINAGNATAAMLSYVENGSTASQNYAAGTYICWQSLLYTADTAINAGDAFYSTGVNKNLTAVGGGGFNNLIQSSYHTNYYYFKINKMVFVRYRGNVSLTGQTTTIATGLPLPDTTKITLSFPFNANNGLNMYPAWADVTATGGLTVLVTQNGSRLTSGTFTISFFISYPEA